MKDAVFTQIGELSRIVTKSRPRGSQIINPHSTTTSKTAYWRLFQGFAAGNFEDDNEAARSLGLEEADLTYFNLRKKLYDKLLNTLFVLDTEDDKTKPWAQGMYRAHKLAFMVRVTAMFGARMISVRLSRKLYDLAALHELTEHSIAAIEVLRIHANMLGRTKLARKYQQELLEKIELLTAEHRASGFIETLGSKFALTGADKPVVAKEAIDYLDELLDLKARFKTFKLGYYYRRLSVLCAQIELDYPRAISACRSGMEFLREHPLQANNARRAGFAIACIDSYLQIRQYEEGRKLAIESESFLPAGTNNWFFLKQSHFLIAMHSASWDEAATIHNLVVSHPRFSTLPSHVNDMWRLFGLYLAFAMRKVPNVVHAGSGKIRLKRFLQTMPEFKRDKAGYNISLLILHILYLIESKDLAGVHDRIDALRQYRRRYFRDGSHEQGNAFFRMLSRLEKHDYDIGKVTRLSWRDMEVLKSGRNDSTVLEGVQIIPYDQLWKMVQERLISDGMATAIEGITAKKQSVKEGPERKTHSKRLIKPEIKVS